MLSKMRNVTNPFHNLKKYYHLSNDVESMKMQAEAPPIADSTPHISSLATSN